MGIIKDEAAQSSAEYILLFGGVIAIVVAASWYYKNYLVGLGNSINSTELQNVTNQINNLTNKFS